MKRSPINRVSSRQKIINECKVLLRKILVIKRGDRCEICERRTQQGLFHIIRVGEKPRIQLLEANVLLACWQNCHFPWHHYGAGDPRTEAIQRRIIKLRGEDYRTKLLIIEKGMSKLTEFYLKMKRQQLRQELKGCSHEKENKKTTIT